MSVSGEFKAGQIASYKYAWKQITHDPWILHVVSGFNIPFVEIPIQNREPFPYKLSDLEKQAADVEIEKLLKKRVLEKVEDIPGQVISNIFFRPKKDGSFRMILDLTWVNKFVEYQHFKMCSLGTAKDMLRRNCWMASIDLKDAYYSVPVAFQDRRFLRFRWKGVLYQYSVMPNGLACAPRFFTKLLNPVFAYLRSNGHECFQYIDDSFIVADTYNDCIDSLKEVVQVLQSLGFVIHPDKSVFQPNTTITFLGFALDSQEMVVSLTKDKVEKFCRAGIQLLQKESASIREVAGLVGLIIAYSQAFDYGLAHVKYIENEKIEALKISRGNFDVPMSLSEKAKEDIRWWLRNIGSSAKHVEVASPDVVIFADASQEGWGAHMGSQTAGGRWTEEEAESHINVLELRAIYLALKSFCKSPCQHVRIMTDNTTALAYIKHMGGVRSLQCNDIAHEIWLWCEQRCIWLTVAHIPGVENVLADYKSRHFSDNVEWMLNPKIFGKICQRFGLPQVDLFASRLNKQVELYVSWLPDPGSIAVDAFSIPWTNMFFYAFPPFSCIAHCIQKILQEGASGILVVPMWPTQPWWARLNNLGLPHMNIRTRNHNLLPVGKPKNVQFLNKCPLGIYLFLGKCY